MLMITYKGTRVTFVLLAMISFAGMMWAGTVGVDDSTARRWLSFIVGIPSLLLLLFSVLELASPMFRLNPDDTESTDA